MNTNTKTQLYRFVSAVEILTAAVVTTIGVQTAGEILNQCLLTRQALDNDDTVVESGPVSN